MVKLVQGEEGEALRGIDSPQQIETQNKRLPVGSMDKLNLIIQTANPQCIPQISHNRPI